MKAYRSYSGKGSPARIGIVLSVAFAITFSMILYNGIGLSFDSSLDKKANEAFAQEAEIPNFVRNVAGFWSQGEVSDGEFVNAINYLMNNGIIKTDRIIKLEKKVEELQTKNTQLQNKVDKLSRAIGSRNNNNDDAGSSSSSKNQGLSSGDSQESTGSNVDSEAKVVSKDDLTFIMDSGNYAVGSEVEFKAETGRAGTEVNIQVQQPDGQEKFSRNIDANSDGVATFSFNLSNYDKGTYTVIVTGGSSQLETEFEVSESGSTSSGGTITGGNGNISISGGSSGSASGASTVELQAVQDYYIAGKSIILSGSTESDTTVEIKLIDHNGNEQDSDQATANDGEFSSFLRIPSDAKSGEWKIVAKESGASSSTTKKFTVIGAEDKDNFTVKVEGDEQYSVGDKVVLFGSGVGSFGKQVDISIRYEDSGKIVEDLRAASQSGGIFVSEFTLSEFDYGNKGKYIVEATSERKEATAEFYVGSSSSTSSSSSSDSDNTEEKQDFEITMGLDKSDYATGEEINIDGKIEQSDSFDNPNDVALEVFSPDDVRVDAGQVELSSDGKFEASFVVSETQYGQVGEEYTVKATYENEDGLSKSVTKTFNFVGS